MKIEMTPPLMEAAASCSYGNVKLRGINSEFILYIM